MKFKELAWGAFCFKSDFGDVYIYQPLVTDKNFLSRLQSTPSLTEFQKLRDFLVHYNVRFAPQDLSVWPKLKSHIKRLRSKRLETCDLNDSRIQNEIVAGYGRLFYGAWGGDTVVSKVIHFFNVSLFVMWDTDIQLKYGKSGPQGYLDFLQEIQKEAIEVRDDFQRFSLSGRLEKFLSQKLGYIDVRSVTKWRLVRFLSQKLGYTGTRPLTKFIDDYNWITTTKGYPKTVTKGYPKYNPVIPNRLLKLDP